MKKEYIHYGHNFFDKNAFRPIKNIPMVVKPDGGLWACRKEAKVSWKDFCENEMSITIKDNNHFCFRLSDDANVLKIDSIGMIDNLPKAEYPFSSVLQWTFLDFEELQKGYDAIEVLISKDQALYDALYGWDIDSILVMNPEIIITYG